MKSVFIARDPDLGTISVGRQRDTDGSFRLPLIVLQAGGLDWNANAYMTFYAGGSSQYNRRPLAASVLKRAFSVGLFSAFLESNNATVTSVTDSTLYGFISYLKSRSIMDRTIITHGRTVIRYLRFVQVLNKDIFLIANTPDSRHGDYQVHYASELIVKNGRCIEVISHRSFDSLRPLVTEHDYIRDEELELWLDAITCCSFHPAPSRFLRDRWVSFSLLLEITGSRISEAHSITRSTIKKALQSTDADEDSCWLGNLPVLKGTAKGQVRTVPAPAVSLKIIYAHILDVERRFPSLAHDAIFVDPTNGSPLSGVYLKNYAKKVINSSKHKDALRHITNHSFRHRLVTLAIAEELFTLSRNGNFTNMLSIAAKVCLKLTLLASEQTQATYVHHAAIINSKGSASRVPTPLRQHVKELNSSAISYRSGLTLSTATWT